ncbi:hypothetical protein RQP46_005503 [Phenoliferia psychrophenolica]
MRDLGGKVTIEEGIKGHQNPRYSRYAEAGPGERGTTGTTAELSYLDGADDDDSPYAEVRASVSNLDDPEMPSFTFRSIFIGCLFSVVFGALNTYPSPTIDPPICIILSYPLGRLLAAVLPITSWRTPKFLRQLGFDDEFSFNPGPFNIKEHTVIIMMVNTSAAPAFALNYSLTSGLFYGQPTSFGFDLFLFLSTQMVGFGTAGVARRFLVWPAGLIWPQNLVYCTTFNTLHAEDDDDEGAGLTRFRFFTYVCAAAFVYYFLPGFLFQALSVFSFICWAAPKNAVVNQLFGLSTGLGMSLVTFDWLQICYIGSPLVVPWWSMVNITVGFVLGYWIIVPIMYYMNVFDRFGESYDITRVFDTVTLRLNETAYSSYSPVYLPMSFAIVYGLSFALSTALLVHTALYHWNDIWRQLFQPSNPIDEDVHARLMRSYPEAWGSVMPVWALILALLMGFIYVVPGGLVYALSAQQISINLMSELVAGYAMPGDPFGNMPQGMAMQYLQDLNPTASDFPW